MGKHKNTWQKRDAKLRELGMTYREYLEGEHWIELKVRFRKSKLCKRKCKTCGGKKKLDIHHKTYKRLGHEWLIDLIELCHSCHMLVHEAYRNKTSTRTNLWNVHKKVARQKKNERTLP